MPKKNVKTPTEVHSNLAVEYVQVENPVEVAETSLIMPDKVLDSRQVLLEVHRAYSLLQAGATRVVVENLGGGDVYVSPDPFVYKPEFMVVCGERREFTGAVMYAYAASRPTVQLTTFA